MKRWWYCVLIVLVSVIVACGTGKPGKDLNREGPFGSTQDGFSNSHSEHNTTDTYPYTHYQSLPDSFLQHMPWGLPYDSDTSDDFLIFRSQYILSYNTLKGGPNWVMWYLHPEDYGTAGRHSGNFMPDPLLPDSLFIALHRDFTHSGFDRGHMVRSHERTATRAHNLSTFFMTNILPQTPDLNRGVWLDFERHCENLCLKESRHLLIVAGGVYQTPRSLSSQEAILIPDSLFKLVYSLPLSVSFHEPDTSLRVYAVMMPNTQGIRRDPWTKYARPPASLSERSGYTLFPLKPGLKYNE